MVVMRNVAALALAALSSCNAMPSAETWRTVDDSCDPPVRVLLRGNAFTHEWVSESGYTVCKKLEDGKAVYFFAEKGDDVGLACSTEVLTCAQQAPSFAVAKGVIAAPILPPADLASGDDASLVERIRTEREAGTFSRQAVRRLKNLVLLMRFADHKNSPVPSPESYKRMLVSPGGDPDVAPTGSVTDVFNANLFGKIDIETTVVGWVDVSFTQKQATGSVRPDGRSCGGSCSTGNPKLRAAILEALETAERNGLVNIAEMDSDKDGYLDMFTVIHSGWDASTGADAGVDWIWSHKSQLPRAYTSRFGQARVYQYNVNPGLWGEEGYEISRIGVIAHESMHYLGLPDLYDTDYSSRGIANYGLMAYSWGYDKSQRYPPSLSPWAKIELGIAEPIEITEDGVYELPNVQSSPEGTLFVLRMRYNNYLGEDYIAIENRYPTGFDQLLPGGILIWHIDPAKGNNRDEGYPGKAGWPQAHYMVRVIQADGKYDLEQPTDVGNRGDEGDWWRAEAGEQVIDDLTEPGLNGYVLMQYDKCSGHRLSDFSAVGETMTFKYTRMDKECSGTPINPPSPTPPSPTPTPPTPTPPTTPAPTPEPEWQCSPQYFDDGRYCDCACGRIDPDCRGPYDSLYCGNTNSASPGFVCDLSTNRCVTANSAGLEDGAEDALHQGPTRPGTEAVEPETPNVEPESPDVEPESSPTSLVAPVAAAGAAVGVIAIAAAAVVVRRRRSAARSEVGADQLEGAVSNPRFEEQL